MLIFELISLLKSFSSVLRHADLAFHLVESQVLVGQNFVELFLRVWRLDLIDPAVDLFVTGGQVELGGALYHDLLIDEVADHVQPDDVRLFLRRLLVRFAQCVLVSRLHIRAQDGLAVHSGHGVRTMTALAAGRTGCAHSS